MHSSHFTLRLSISPMAHFAKNSQSSALAKRGCVAANHRPSRTVLDKRLDYLVASSLSLLAILEFVLDQAVFEDIMLLLVTIDQMVFIYGRLGLNSRS